MSDEKDVVAYYIDAAERILEWADEEDRGFDTEFVESVLEQIETNNSIFPGQMQAIDNILTGFNIPE